MLKSRIDNSVWLVQQHDHSRVAGYLAAHWGGANGFARPGYFAPFTEPERLRQEVVWGIAEHDNGWWEWEASPAIDQADGLPLHLADVAKRSPGEGLERWRFGVPRLADQHPYIALLISLHAFHLYCFAFDDEAFRAPDSLRHPLFGSPERVQQLVADRELTASFLREQLQIQEQLRTRLQADDAWEQAAAPAHRAPHLRLLQVLDALSLLLCFGGRQELTIADVPRASGEELVAMQWRPIGERRIVCDPYPFDLDPLPVYLPVRIATAEQLASQQTGGALPLTRLHSLPVETVRFELISHAG